MSGLLLVQLCVGCLGRYGGSISEIRFLLCLGVSNIIYLEPQIRTPFRVFIVFGPQTIPVGHTLILTCQTLRENAVPFENQGIFVQHNGFY